MAASSTDKVLTPAREAVWKALREWPLWAAKIVTMCDTDARVKDFLRQDANISRCPMLSALWNTTNPAWWVHTQQVWRCPLEVSLWVHEDRQTLSEQLLEDAIDAVLRAEHQTSTAQGPLSILKQLCGENPQILDLQAGIPVQVGDDGRHRLLRSFVVFQLPLKKNPILRPGA